MKLFFYSSRNSKNSHEILTLLWLIMNAQMQPQILNVLESHRASLIVASIRAFAAHVQPSMLVEILTL
jgi:hypothetical protein